MGFGEKWYVFCPLAYKMLVERHVNSCINSMRKAVEEGNCSDALEIANSKLSYGDRLARILWQ